MSDTPKNNAPGSKKGAPVFTYLAIMFAAAFLMLLLAYFIQQRNNEAAMSGLKDSISSFESIDELMEENQELREALASLTEANEALTEQINTLADELDGMTRKYEDICAGWEEATADSSALATLYYAEIKFNEKDYAGAADELADWNTAFLEETIDLYDAKTQFYNPDALALRPRYDALTTSLIELGYLTKTEDGSLEAATP